MRRPNRGRVAALSHQRPRSHSRPSYDDNTNGGKQDRRIYQIEMNDGDPLPLANFRLLVMTGKSFFTATGLTSQQACSFRVNAVGADGIGPWSDVATTKPL